MDGEILLEYGIDLCDYILGQIRPHLHELAKRPMEASSMRPKELYRLTMPTWVGWSVAALPTALADHIWAGVSGDPVLLLLGNKKIDAIGAALHDPPMHLEVHCLWVPFRGLHRRAIECVPEIRSNLTKQAAEEWSEDSARFAARLSEEGLLIADGIDTVQQWLWCVRRLRKVIGAEKVSSHTPQSQLPPKNQKSGITDNGEVGRVHKNKKGMQEINPVTHPPILTPQQIVKRYPVSLSTVYSACRSGILAHSRVSAKPGARGKYLIKQGDLLAWFDSLRVALAPTPPPVLDPISSGSQGEPFSELNPQRLARAWSSG